MTANWVQAPATAPFTSRGFFPAVTYNSKMWVLGGQVSSTYANDVWSSTDGASWVQELAANPTPGPGQFPTRIYHTALAFNSKLWIIGGSGWTGSLNDVWSSVDGITWTQVLADNAAPGSNQFSQRYGHTSLVYNGLMWVLGGNGGVLNEVWSSPDGVTWTKAPPTAPFLGRVYHASVVHNGEMWVIGGSPNLVGVSNLVWHSTDGSTWVQSPLTAPFPARHSHQALAYNGLMWVLGGSPNSNDVWYSSDGATWRQATVTTPFPARSSHGSVVFNSAMWVLGGFDGGSTTNDVWHSP